MRIASRILLAGIAAIGLSQSGRVAASQPSMNECLEGSDFIANAARSRDAGMSESAFLGRMRDDFMAIRAYPNELRWFVHDASDETFLLESARDVFDRPGPPDRHRQAFLEACIERMPEPAPAQMDPPREDPETRPRPGPLSAPG
jgi:hypothetical protein